MSTFTEPDPAERSAPNRLFYRNRRTDMARPLGKPVVLLGSTRWIDAAVLGLAGSPRPVERAPILREYVRVASSSRKHFPLPGSARGLRCDCRAIPRVSDRTAWQRVIPLHIRRILSADSAEPSIRNQDAKLHCSLLLACFD